MSDGPWKEIRMQAHTLMNQTCCEHKIFARFLFVAANHHVHLVFRRVAEFIRRKLLFSFPTLHLAMAQLNSQFSKLMCIQNDVQKQ